MSLRNRPGIRRLLFVLAAIIFGGLGIYRFREWQSWQRSENDRAIENAIRSLRKVQHDFLARDLDGNRVADYWTGDVTGLFNLVVNGQELQLIDRSLAEADTSPLHPLLKSPQSYHGYFLRVLDGEGSEEDIRSMSYRQDTGGTPSMGKVHNMEKFGYCAFPEVPGVTGSFIYIIGTNGSLRKGALQGSPTRDWPPDSECRKWWNACWGGG